MKHIIFLIIFFILCFPVFVSAESFFVKNDTGILWTDPTGSVSYTSFGTKIGDDHSSLSFDTGALFSDISAADFSLPFFQAQIKRKIGSGGFDVSMGFASHDALSSKVDKYQFSNSGASGFYLSGGSFFSIQDVTIKSSLLYASAHWNDGDLYYLFGKPDIKHIFVPELSVEYNEQHRITARSLFLDGGLLSNDAVSLTVMLMVH
jgi:hypothetical protein